MYCCLPYSTEQIASLTADLEQKRSYNPVASVPTIVSPPRVSESEMYATITVNVSIVSLFFIFEYRAAKAKLQRLEKETKEMEKSLESLRHSQAKLAELERTNKKLNTQSHEDKKEIFKLKEVPKKAHCTTLAICLYNLTSQSFNPMQHLYLQRSIKSAQII